MVVVLWVNTYLQIHLVLYINSAQLFIGQKESFLIMKKKTLGSLRLAESC